VTAENSTAANQTHSDVRLSFEFFPPKNARMERALWRNIGQLELLKPSFFSVTYGAGGSDRERSLQTLENMKKECQIPLAAHLTCGGHSKAEVLEIAKSIHERGVHSLVALRGDADSVAGGFEHTEEFIAALKEVADFDISVAAYPEVHPMAKDEQSDLDQLARKLDAGANRAITQYFFDTDSYLRFRDKVAAKGVKQSIVPGILPIHNFERMLSFSERCGARVPEHIHKRFVGTEGDNVAQQKLGADIAVEMSQQLLDEGVKELHYYTLNIPSHTFGVTSQLGLPLKGLERN